MLKLARYVGVNTDFLTAQAFIFPKSQPAPSKTLKYSKFFKRSSFKCRRLANINSCPERKYFIYKLPGFPQTVYPKRSKTDRSYSLLTLRSVNLRFYKQWR